MTTVPARTKEERLADLEKAKQARAKRAEICADLKAGKLTLDEVLDMRDDPVVGRMRIRTLISSVPAFGVSKTDELMESAGIAESRRLKGLGKHQEAALRARCADYCGKNK